VCFEHKAWVSQITNCAVVRRRSLRAPFSADHAIQPGAAVSSPGLRATSARRSAGPWRTRRSQPYAGRVPRDRRLRGAGPASASPEQQPASSGSAVQLSTTAHRRSDQIRPNSSNSSNIVIQRYNAVLLHDCFVKEEEKVHSSLIFVLFLYCTAHFFHSMGIEYRGQNNNNNNNERDFILIPTRYSASTPCFCTTLPVDLPVLWPSDILIIPFLFLTPVVFTTWGIKIILIINISV